MRLRNRRVREFDGYSDDDDFVLEEIDEDVRFDDDAVEELFEEELLEDLEFDEWEAEEEPFVEDTEPWDDVESVGVSTDLEWFDDPSDVTRRGLLSRVSAVLPWSRSRVRRPRPVGRLARRRRTASESDDNDTTVIRPDFVILATPMRELTVGDSGRRFSRL
jgi:hypothetical protein